VRDENIFFFYFYVSCVIKYPVDATRDRTQTTNSIIWIISEQWRFPQQPVELSASLWLSVWNQFWAWIFNLSRKSGGEVSFLDTLELKMVSLRLFHTSLAIYQPKLHNIQQYLNFHHQYSHHAIKSRTFLNLPERRRI